MVKVKEEKNVKKISYLLLEDGTLFEGVSFGANVNTDGEIGKF
jgi:carbamoylphosphate synthase small subunit